jgi:glycosyltransferase involved in cell wall biosynthesis
MNIFLINHYAGSPEHGMEYRPYYLSREWVKQGHQVTIIAASQSHLRIKAPIIFSDFQIEKITGIQYLWIKTPSYSGNGISRTINIFAFVAQLVKCRKKILKHLKPDLIINSSTYPLDTYPAYWIAKQSNAKLIFEVHDLWPLSPIELGGMSPRHPFILLMQAAENFACRNSDHIISLLPKAKQHLQDHGMAAEKFGYIPNGIDITEWENNNSPIPPEHQQLLTQLKQQNKFIIGYAGGHSISNALKTLIETAIELQHNTQIAFVLVGKGIEKESLQTTAKEANLQNIFFLPPIPKASIPAFLNEVDACYIGWQNHPIYRFGISPNKIMDYMMAAKPILHSISAGNDPVADSGCGISVPAEDPKAIAQAAQSLAALTPDDRKKMGLKGKEYVMEHHDYKILAQKFIDLVS